MDEIDQRTRPKRTRVLRATDVIPPFDNIPTPADAGETDSEPLEPAAPQPARVEDPVDVVVGEQAEGEEQATGDVPRYDLAENILAEQRRVASRRRRAPSQPQEEPFVPDEPGAAEPSAIDMPSEDLPELQQLVAEIVARDIERLCRRPNTN